MPAVSVVVICFDDARHLPAAVGSATGQSLRDLEVVVVDDGSRDETPAVAAALTAADARVRYHRLDTNSGGWNRPRNGGGSLATREFVPVFDRDHVIPRPGLERLPPPRRRAR